MPKQVNLIDFLNEMEQWPLVAPGGDISPEGWLWSDATLNVVLRQYDEENGNILDGGMFVTEELWRMVKGKIIDCCTKKESVWLELMLHFKRGHSIDYVINGRREKVKPTTPIGSLIMSDELKVSKTYKVGSFYRAKLNGVKVVIYCNSPDDFHIGGNTYGVSFESDHFEEILGEVEW